MEVIVRVRVVCTIAEEAVRVWHRMAAVVVALTAVMTAVGRVESHVSEVDGLPRAQTGVQLVK